MEKRFSKVMLVVLFLTVLTLAISLAMPLVRAQSLSVSPDTGKTGSSLTFSASISGFTPSDTVNFIFGSNLFLGSCTVASDGTGSINFNMPSTVNPGSYIITANGLQGESANTQFIVTGTPVSVIQTTPTPVVGPTVAPTAAPTAIPPTYVPPVSTSSSGFWSPLVIGVIAVVIALVGVMAAVFVMRGGRQKPAPYRAESGLEPRPAAPPTYGQQPPYSPQGMNQPPAYGQPSPYSSSRYQPSGSSGYGSRSPYSSSRYQPSGSSAYGSRPPYSSQGMNQPSAYSQRTILCPNCRRAVREDLSVCPFCGKRLR